MRHTPDVPRRPLCEPSVDSYGPLQAQCNVSSTVRMRLGAPGTPSTATRVAILSVLPAIELIAETHLS